MRFMLVYTQHVEYNRFFFVPLIANFVPPLIATYFMFIRLRFGNAT